MDNKRHSGNKEQIRSNGTYKKYTAGTSRLLDKHWWNENIIERMTEDCREYAARYLITEAEKYARKKRNKHQCRI